MFQVLALIGAFLFFRAVLPRTPHWSSTKITPYMNALDGMMSAQQVSSVLDEVAPYESWRASRRTKDSRDAPDEQLPPDSIDSRGGMISAVQGGPSDDLGRQR